MTNRERIKQLDAKYVTLLHQAAGTKDKALQRQLYDEMSRIRQEIAMLEHNLGDKTPNDGGRNDFQPKGNRHIDGIVEKFN